MLLDNLKDLERHIFLQKGNDLMLGFMFTYMQCAQILPIERT